MKITYFFTDCIRVKTNIGSLQVIATDKQKCWQHHLVSGSQTNPENLLNLKKVHSSQNPSFRSFMFWLRQAKLQGRAASHHKELDTALLG